MKDKLKEIEIPFGANDSELCGWEYTIPEGMEATIVDNKIVVKKKESEDERIRKELLKHLKEGADGYEPAGGSEDYKRWLVWFEKQGEQIDLANKEYWRRYREGKQEILDKYSELEKQGEKGTIRNDKEIPLSAWNEEDEMMLECVLDKIGDLGTGEMYKFWLKSLKDRYTWKPSEEQIKATKKIGWDGYIMFSASSLVSKAAINK